MPAKKPLSIFIVSSLAFVGGLEQQTTQLALGLGQSGQRVVLFSYHFVPSSSQYLNKLQSAKIAVVTPPKWLAQPLGDYNYQTRLVEFGGSLAKPLLFPLAIIDSIVRRRCLGRSWQGALGKWRGVLSHLIHQDRLDYLLYGNMLAHSLRQRPDIVHLHGYRFPYGRLIHWLHRHRWRVVYTERSCPSPATLPLHPISLLKKADAVIAISDAGKEAIGKFWGFDGMIHRIPQHIIDDPYPQGVPYDLADTDKPSVAVTCVSRLSPEKGVDFLIKAIPDVLKRFPQTRFLIAGGGPAMDSLVAMSRSLGVQNSVQFIGMFEHHYLREIMDQTDIIVQPSLHEGLGGSLVEAMAYGKPIVASAVGGILNLVSHEVNGLLIPPGDPSSLACALNRLIADPILRRRLGLAGRRFYEQGPYKPSAVVNATLRLYTSVLGDSIRSIL